MSKIPGAIQSPVPVQNLPLVAFNSDRGRLEIALKVISVLPHAGGER